jgi:hypothetical protein
MRAQIMAKRTIFTVTTPLGDRVVLTRDRWREIIRYKHPAMADHETDVRDCLREPERVRASSQDEAVHLNYRALGDRYVCAVVGGDDKSKRFLITAYFTAKIKTGTELWAK